MKKNDHDVTPDDRMHEAGVGSYEDFPMRVEGLPNGFGYAEVSAQSCHRKLLLHQGRSPDFLI